MYMREERQIYADQILIAIENGKLSRDETEKRLQAIVDEALSGPVQTEGDMVRVELCNSLLWQLYTQGEIHRKSSENACQDGMGEESLLETHIRSIKERITQRYLARKRRRRVAVLGLTAMAAVMVLVIGLSTLNVIPLFSWLKGEPVQVETQPEVQNKINLSPLVISNAIAEHMESGQQEVSTSDSAAYIEFLGFDPGVPETLCGTYTVADYQVMVEPSSITLSIPYRMDQDGDSSDGEQFNFTMTLLNSAEDSTAYTEQDEDGDLMEIQGVPVYANTEFGRGYYIWNSDQVIYSLVLRESIPDREDVLSAIIAKTQD